MTNQIILNAIKAAGNLTPEQFLLFIGGIFTYGVIVGLFIADSFKKRIAKLESWLHSLFPRHKASLLLKSKDQE